jgi:cell division protein FtsL
MMAARRRYRIRWIRVLVLLTAAYFLYLAAGQQYELYTIHRETYTLKDRIADLEQSNKSLTDEKARLVTPAYVEKIAREQLGLVKPGEVPYIP